MSEPSRYYVKCQRCGDTHDVRYSCASEPELRLENHKLRAEVKAMTDLAESHLLAAMTRAAEVQALKRESDGLHDLFDKEHAQLVAAEREIKRLKDRIEVMEKVRQAQDEVSFKERCNCGRPTWTDHYHLRCLGCDRRLGECKCGPFQPR